MGASSDTIVAKTEPGATDVYDSGMDQPLPPPPPTTWVRGYFPHPEWQAVVVGQPTDNFAVDSRATLLTGGQSKTWDFVVQSADISGPGSSVTITLDTSGLPAGLTAQIIDVEGVGGTPMAVITSPFTFTHPGFYQLKRFQLVVQAT
jgi:hypothetical protein